MTFFQILMPLVSNDQGCFCCGPSTSNPGSMQGLRVSLDSTSSQIEPLMSPSTHINDPANLGTLLEQVHIGSSVMASNPQCHVQSREMASEDSDNSVFFSPSTEGAGDIGHFSFRYLQSQEIGDKCRNANSNSSVSPNLKLSSSAPTRDRFSCETFSERYSKEGELNLDTALDELGMLSTVTNSRRQYLLEMRGKAASIKRDMRLRTKSESSPNLTNLCGLKGFSVLHVDPKYVAGVSSGPSSLPGSSSNSLQGTPQRCQPLRAYCWRDPESFDSAVSDHRRRSLPRMSRLRKDRYRRTRCPYKIPNRLCNSLQEADFPQLHTTYNSSSFLPLNSSPPHSDRLSPRKPESSYGMSKSNTASPVKPSLPEPRLIRSVSAENLLVRRRLEKDLIEVQQSSRVDEDNLDLVASQFTHLHMS